MSETDAQIEELYDRAIETMEAIATKDDEDTGNQILSYLDDLEDIIDEAEDLLKHVDLSDLADAVEWEDIPEAFDQDDLSAAIQDDEDAVTLGKLLKILDLSKLWSSMNAREAWREKREFEDELDDVTDDEVSGDEDGSMDVSMPNAGIEDFDPESVENAIQSQMMDSVDEFREALIKAHVRLREFRENNKDRFPDHRRTNSRNPTAASTMPGRQEALGRGTRYSTVPRETKYSTAPNRRRIYGNRFERAEDEMED